MELKTLGYGKIFWELFWASTKALVIILIISSIRMGFFFKESGFSEDTFDAFGGSVLMHFIGFILSFPLLLPLILAGMFLVRFILMKGGYNIYILIVAGAISSEIFFSFLTFFSNKPITFETIISSNIYFLLGGGLTGFFIYKQLEKISS